MIPSPNPPGTRAVLQATERHILCVDDDLEFLKSLEFFLPEQVNQDAGGLWYRFVFLTDPHEALEALTELVEERESVAMLISDQKMPAMKGTEFFAQARRISPGSVRVLLTAHAGLEAAIAAINEQLLDKYLTKPIENQHDFAVSIRHLLQRFEMQQRIQAQSKVIRDLYDFANTLHTMDGLRGTLEHIVGFTRSTMRCQEVRILTPLIGSAGDPESEGTAAGSAGSEPQPPRHERVGVVDRVEQIPWAWHVMGSDEAWAQAGPVAYAAMTSGEQFLGLIVASGLDGSSALAETDLRTLTYIASTASIAVHNQLNRIRVQQALEESRNQAFTLEEANSRLLILDRMKSDFLSFISHELRTPLNYIAAVGTLDQGSDPADHKKMVEIIRQGYQRLDGFISKGLNYLDWLASKSVRSTELTDIAQVVRSQASRHVVSGVAFDLELSVPDTPCLAHITREYVEEVVQILLDNAAKFSEGGRRVRIDVAHSAESIRLTLMDHGRGFPPEWASELFQPFTIVDTLHHQRGTALSLAKAAAMVETHGGRIRAESEGFGKGATFIVDFPAFGLRTPKHLTGIHLGIGHL